jgi:hypothetical protein
MSDPDEQTVELAFAALASAEDVLASAGRRVDGVVLLVEIDGQGVTIAINDAVDAGTLSTLLAEASWRAAGAGA